ncbi:hypothetical protein [Gordonia malaquae]|uniref:hypothetical protein n=1 Tax=Gordonia malaquae TaxID=410332 RepID=UPI0030FE8605
MSLVCDQRNATTRPTTDSPSATRRSTVTTQRVSTALDEQGKVPTPGEPASKFRRDAPTGFPSAVEGRTTGLEG